MLIRIICATIATFFFAILFNTKKENLLYASLGGGIGSFTYEILVYYGINIYTSIFLAAIIFATYSEIMARVCKTTATTFAICALIPLVPGNGMYQTMINIVNNDLNAAVQYGLSTLSTAGILALGIMIVSTFAKLRRQRKNN